MLRPFDFHQGLFLHEQRQFRMLIQRGVNSIAAIQRHQGSYLAETRYTMEVQVGMPPVSEKIEDVYTINYMAVSGPVVINPSLQPAQVGAECATGHRKEKPPGFELTPSAATYRSASRANSQRRLSAPWTACSSLVTTRETGRGNRQPACWKRRSPSNERLSCGGFGRV